MSTNDEILKDIKKCATCEAAVMSFIFLNRMKGVHGQKLDGLAVICIKHMKIFGFKIEGKEGE